MAGRRLATVYVSDRRLYLDECGAVVEASSPRRHKLLVPAGGRIPLEQAERLGLVEMKSAGPGLSREDAVSVDHPLYKFMIDPPDIDDKSAGRKPVGAMPAAGSSRSARQRRRKKEARARMRGSDASVTGTKQEPLDAAGRNGFDDGS